MKENVDNIRYLYSESAWYEDNQIWISVMEFNGLYCYDIKSNEADFIGTFPFEKSTQKRLHGKTIKVGKEIYFLPDRSKHVHVYNMETGTFSGYDMGIQDRIASRNGIYYREKIYFICNSAEIMVCNIDIRTKRIEKQKIEVDDWKYGLSSDIVFIDGKIYFACKYPNVVVEYSCDENSYRKYWVGEAREGFGTICYDGDVFWLSGKAGITRWDKKSSMIKNFDKFPKGFGMNVRLSLESDQIEMIRGFSNKYSEAEMPFWFSVFFDEKIWLFPNRTNMIICVDSETGNIKEFCLQGEEEDKESLLARHRYTNCHYLGGIQNNNLIFVSTKSKKYRLIEQAERIDIKEFYIRCKEPKDISLYLSKGRLGVRFEDGDMNSLEEFMVINPKRNMDNPYNRKSIGRLIYEAGKEY